MNAGVVIGSYGMPGVVELNIACIRAACGPDVPILISDDCTPQGEGLERLQGLPDKWDGVQLRSTERNMGHARGDVITFRTGLLWAVEKGLDYLVKFSQRFILTTSNWLSDDCWYMYTNGIRLMSQPAYHLHMHFPMRTECVIMNVPAAVPVIRTLKDCQTAAEHHIHWAFNQQGIRMERWPRIPPDRFHRYQGIVWHNSDANDTYGESHKAYEDLAARHGIDLGPEFSGAGWHVIAQHRPGTEYAHFK